MSARGGGGAVRRRLSLLCFVLVVHLLLHDRGVDGQTFAWQLVPSSCASIPGNCCATRGGATMACGADLGWGSCVAVTDVWQVATRSCSCNGNRFGLGCEECLFGWGGANCDVKLPLLFRRSITDPLTNLTQFTRGVQLLKSTTHPDWRRRNNGAQLNYYDTLTVLHSDAFAFNAAHRGPSFLTWHRYFLLLFDRYMQRVLGDPTFTVPYWDWQSGTAELFSAAGIGGDGVGSNSVVMDGPFVNFRAVTQTGAPQPFVGITRELGRDAVATTLPAATSIAAALNPTSYDASPWDGTPSNSVRNLIEGWVRTSDSAAGRQTVWMHNRVHRWVGGWMSNSDISPNDPVFYLNHAHVDLLYERWLTANPAASYRPTSSGPLGHNAGDTTGPLYPRLTNQRFFALTNNFGYQYVNPLLPTPAPPTTTPAPTTTTPAPTTTTPAPTTTTPAPTTTTPAATTTTPSPTTTTPSPTTTTPSPTTTTPLPTTTPPAATSTTPDTSVPSSTVPDPSDTATGTPDPSVTTTPGGDTTTPSATATTAPGATTAAPIGTLTTRPVVTVTTRPGTPSTTPAPSAPQKKKKGSNAVPIAIIAGILVLVLLAAGLVGVLLVRWMNKPAKPPGSIVNMEDLYGKSDYQKMNDNA